MLIDVGDTRLWMESIGAGGPLVLMHGVGLDHTYLRPHLDRLSSERRIIYYDHRGNGRSASPEDWRQVSHSTWFDDTERLRQKLGLDKIVLFGHSYGGFLALEYALEYGDHLAGLILCATSPALDHMNAAMEIAKGRCSAEVFQLLSEALSGPCADDETLKAVWLRILPLYFQKYDPETTPDLLSKTHFSAAAYSHAFFQCLARYNVCESIRRISAPVLIVGGRHDWIIPPVYGPERLHALLPHSELAIFEQSGHFPFVEENEAFIQVLRAWLQRIS